MQPLDPLPRSLSPQLRYLVLQSRTLRLQQRLPHHTAHYQPCIALSPCIHCLPSSAAALYAARFEGTAQSVASGSSRSRVHYT